jgi:hypothetical protein
MNRFFRNRISAQQAKKIRGEVQKLSNGCLLIMISLLCCSIIGCGKKNTADLSAEKARQDSLMAVIRSAQDRSIQGASRIVNQASPAGPGKFSSFSDSAIKSARARPSLAMARPAAKISDTLAKSDTASTLDSAIATNAKNIKVDSGSAEDKRLDSMMLIANTLSYRYQQMVMTHTHRNLAEAAHQNPAKTRRLLNKIIGAAPDRFMRNKKAGEIRNQRLQALQNQMQGQDQPQPQPGESPGDSGK